MATPHDITTQTADILVVDDTIESLKLLTDILSKADYRVRPANGPQSALESALAQPPSLILLDVKMPEMDGFEVCRRLRQDERTRDIPIIFVSALQETQDRVQGFEAGGVDFISKPFQEAEVLARVNTHLQLRRMHLHLEDRVSERTTELTQANEALQIEIAERKRAEEALQASQRLLSLVIDNVPALVSYVDRHQQYRFVNQRYERLYGLPQSHFVGKHVQEILGPEGYAGVEHNIAAVLAGDELFYEEVFKYPDRKQRWMEVQYVPDRDFAGDVQGFIALITDITERKQVEQQVQNYQQRLKALASQLTITEEQERRRLAADLHDHIGHVLVLARMQVHAVHEATTQIQTTALLNDLSNLLLTAIQETKTLIFELSAPTMNEIGLAAAIAEWLEEYFERRYGLETELIDTSSNRVLDLNVRAILFRNVRELLTNVVKHAHAKHVTVALEDADECLRIRVKDDGVGVDPDAVARHVKPGGGFGLFSIQERLADLGGSLEILSEPGQGCEIIMTAPFERS